MQESSNFKLFWAPHTFVACRNHFTHRIEQKGFNERNKEMNAELIKNELMIEIEELEQKTAPDGGSSATFLD
jgi:hypothetical protein